MLLYVLTISISAFLLFVVQPVIAKAILPWFGGSASVWASCMLFFQFTLLAGYLYAHWSVRYLNARRQFLVHVALLAGSLLLIPFTPNSEWKPAGYEDPSRLILALLITSIGLPYFLLSATSPLLQAWYARTRQSAAPYRLFALSNFASMLALLSYPVLIEPFVSARLQARTWAAFYVFFAIVCAVVAYRARLIGLVPAVEPESDAAEPPRWYTWVLWLGLASCASALLLSVTNHLTQDVASVPFLWILPLALYLASFVLCFESEGWYNPAIFHGLAPLAVAGMCYVMYRQPAPEFEYLLPLMATGFLLLCMFCHGEIARTKPPPRYLTGFYLTIATGGAIGGLFVAVVAPRVFKGFFELPASLVFAAVLFLIVFRKRARLYYYTWVALGLLLVVFVIGESRAVAEGTKVFVRNFYGVLRVSDDGEGEFAVRKLLHGSINHGAQYLAEERRMRPITYYGPNSGAGVAIRNTRNSTQRVGVIGLGTGTLASYGRPGDYYRIYEINPLVIQVAKEEFTFLQDSKARIDLVLGDARLSLEREGSQQFDTLLVDAFSGDSIPVHLLTREAFEIYWRHLKPEGILAIHISNQYLDLQPVVYNLAAASGREALLVDTEDDQDHEIFGSTWVLVLSPQFDGGPEVRMASVPLTSGNNIRLWTDDYSNLFQIMK